MKKCHWSTVHCCFCRWSCIQWLQATGVMRMAVGSSVWHHTTFWSTECSTTPVYLTLQVWMFVKEMLLIRFELYYKSQVQYYSSKSWSTFDYIWLTGHRYMFCSLSYVGALGCGIGTALGCAMRVGEGAVPKEHGTWLYGRGGWCDGLQVDPWRIDITKQVQYLSIFYKSTVVVFVS